MILRTCVAPEGARAIGISGPGPPAEKPTAYACTDQHKAFAKAYFRKTGKRFFDAYIRAIRCNRRMDASATAESSLIVYEGSHCMVFVPKPRFSSQWELNLMVLKSVGNIL